MCVCVCVCVCACVCVCVCMCLRVCTYVCVNDASEHRRRRLNPRAPSKRSNGQTAVKSSYAGQTAGAGLAVLVGGVHEGELRRRHVGAGPPLPSESPGNTSESAGAASESAGAVRRCTATPRPAAAALRGLGPPVAQMVKRKLVKGPRYL